MGDKGISLEDRNLAYFMEEWPEGKTYLDAMLWAQEYSLANREPMMDAVLNDFFGFISGGSEVERINCHHNFAAREVHGGEQV